MAGSAADAEVWYRVIRLPELLQRLRTHPPDAATQAERRDEIRALLKEIHEAVLPLETERNAYYILFALTAYCDELAQGQPDAAPAVSWEPLQMELFGIRDAGTLFYRYVDLFRGRHDIPPRVHEVYYFCLKAGFKGNYITDPAARKAYLDELEAHIDVERLPPPKPLDDEPSQDRRRLPTALYYVAVALVVAALRLALLNVPLELPL